jgi:four helix bundle protein
MKLEDLEIYQLAMDLGNEVWNLTKAWNYFEKYTIGKQFVRASDSVAANISEGFGRYHYKDTKNFIYYARASLSETKTWVQKAYERGLISQEISQHLMKKIDKLNVKINNFIRKIGSGQKTSNNP